MTDPIPDPLDPITPRNPDEPGPLDPITPLDPDVPESPRVAR